MTTGADGAFLVVCDLERWVGISTRTGQTTGPRTACSFLRCSSFAFAAHESMNSRPRLQGGANRSQSGFPLQTRSHSQILSELASIPTGQRLVILASRLGRPRPLDLNKRGAVHNSGTKPRGRLG